MLSGMATERRSKMGPAPIDREEKACSTCKLVLPLESFGPDKNRADGKKRQCRPCLAAYMRERNAAKPKPPKREARTVERRSKMGPAPIDRDSKPCSICKLLLPLEDFGPDTRRADGRKRQCRACANAFQKEWASRNRIKTRTSKFKKKYNWTVEAYKEMYDRQEGRCAICRKPIHSHLEEDGKISTAIDHNHKTGEVRGLLCSWCNPAIGYMEDDPIRLERAAAYVRS